MKDTYSISSIKEFGMFNLKFDTLKSAMELNKLNEKELVHHLQMYMKNQNYRSTYNQKKSELLKTPEVKAMLKKLSGK